MRVASVGFVLAQIVAPALGLFTRAHPGVALALHADDRLARFDRREADIAIRLGRTGDDSALMRKIGEARFRLCRAASAPTSGDAPIARYSDAFAHLPEMRMLDRLRPGGRAAFTADRLDILIEAAVASGPKLDASGSLGEPRSALRLRRRYDRRAADLSPASMPIALARRASPPQRAGSTRPSQTGPRRRADAQRCKPRRTVASAVSLVP